jgi:sigma-B regulation protein RsbU (phosphoserine phosphatase)
MEILFDEEELKKIEGILSLSSEKIEEYLYYKSLPEPILKILKSVRNCRELNNRLIKLEKKLLLKELEIDSIFELTSMSFSNFQVSNIINLLRNIIMGQVGVSKIIIFKVEEDNIIILENKGIKYDRKKIADEINLKIKNNTNPIKAEIKLDRIYNLYYSFTNKRGIGIIAGAKINGEELKERDTEFIETVVTQILIILENIDLYRDFLEKERLEKEFQIARKIQKRMLPEKKPEWEGLLIDATTLSSYEVGGDLYDFIEIDDELYITIGDVSGKGLSAAFIMASSQASIRAILLNSKTPLEDIIKKINTVLLSITKNEMYMSFIILKFKKGDNRLEYYNAGHLPGILYGKGGKIEELHKGSYILGLFENIEGTGEIINMEKGDKIILFTDGVSEFEINGKEIGIEGVKTLIKKHDGDIVKIKKELLTFAPAERLKDDFTLVEIGKNS